MRSSIGAMPLKRHETADRRGARLYHDTVAGPDERAAVKDVLRPIAAFYSKKC